MGNTPVAAEDGTTANTSGGRVEINVLKNDQLSATLMPFRTSGRANDDSPLRLVLRRGNFPDMENKIELLQVELDAINLWDRLYVEIPQPDVIDKDACAARFLRRAQIISELHLLASRS